ncbi:MAG: hypothetical protein WBA61_09965 [Aequorivita sp.]
MKKRLPIVISMVIACLFFTACLRDTDFEQTENIVLTPVVELDLIYFTLRGTDFFDTINSRPIPTLRDTTLIKFLNDSTLHESLKRAEFYFRFSNSIPRSFVVDFQFLGETNDTTYVAQTTVAQGSPTQAVLTEFIENVEGDDVLQLTKANKVVVSVTISSSHENLEGVLNLKSKTTYFLEY